MRSPQSDLRLVFVLFSGSLGAAHAQSLPLLSPMTPAATLALISQNANTSTSIEFVNNYSGPVTVNWIDYSGTIEFYMTLSPGQSYVQPTFVTHPWIIYDANTGVALEGFLPIAQAAEALITNPAASLTFQTTSLPNGTVGVPYSQQIDVFGGTPPLVFFLGSPSPPPGLTLSTSGLLAGTPTAAGAYSFPIAVTDSGDNSASMTYSVTISAPQAPLQVSPSSLTFSASSSGNSPASQIVTVISGGPTPSTFNVSLDSGQANTPAPTWLTVTPFSGTTPGTLTVSVNPNGLIPGAYGGRILINSTSTVTVTLTVAAAAPQLSVAPATLSFAANAASPGLLDQVIAVSNAGSGSLNFTAAASNPIPWLDSITPSSGQTSPGSPVLVRIRLNTSGLAAGGYKGTIQFSSSAGNVNVPISLFVSPGGPILGVDQSGLLFNALQGQGIGSIKTVQVLNTGASGTTVNFAASITNNANWLAVSPATGAATTTQPALLKFSINSNAQSLAPGAYYAIVQIADPSSGMSPQFVVVVLNVTAVSQVVTPDVSPGGLLFTGAGIQPVTVAVSSSFTVAFTASATTSDGGTWLSVSPASGTVSTANSATVSVSTNPTGLKAGVYTGFANIAIGGQVRGVAVTLIVPPNAAGAAVFTSTSSACTPSKVVLTQSGLTTNFSVPAGFPGTLSVDIYDDCANPLSTGSVFASFTNGDPPLNLHPVTPGTFAQTWQPVKPAGGLTITIQGSSGTLQPAAVQISGAVTSNSVTVPVLFANGTLNNYYPAAALSPGLIAQVYGSGLAGAVGQPNSLPLPNVLQGASVQIGSHAAPLYYVSSTQVNVEIPAELAAGQYPILVTVNGASALPQTLTINALQPGIAAYADGTNNVIAQHADFSYVTAASPAKPSEVVIIYLAGMGATNPSVPSGQGAPTSEPLARVVNVPAVTVGGQNATVEFAGLAPGFVGLYQIDLQVPANASAGSLPLIVSQNGVAGNTTNLIVGQ